MHIAESSDELDVSYRSSISQHNNKLGVFRGRKYLPLSFDSLDYVDCDKVVSHRAIVSDREDIGYIFPVDRVTLYTDKYVFHDHNEIVMRVLPHWYGEGMYLESIKNKAFVNADNGSVGVRNRYNLKVGLAYALADNTLDGTDEAE